MQKEIRCRTQEAPSVPDRSYQMKLTELEKRTGQSSLTQSVLERSLLTRKDQVGWYLPSIHQRGVLSSIVLRGGESPLQGEGLDGST